MFSEFFDFIIFIYLLVISGDFLNSILPVLAQVKSIPLLLVISELIHEQLPTV